jgi:hypothetical protein
LSGPKICEKEHDFEALAMQGEFQHLQILAILAVIAIRAIRDCVHFLKLIFLIPANKKLILKESDVGVVPLTLGKAAEVKGAVMHTGAGPGVLLFSQRLQASSSFPISAARSTPLLSIQFHC